MKFSINSKVLLSRLSAASKAILNKPTVAILGCYRLKAEGGLLTITASSVENTISTSVALDSNERSGEICLDAKRFLELVKSIPDGPLVFEADLDSLAVSLRYSSGRYKITGYPGAEYPSLSDANSDTTLGKVRMTGSHILSALDKVACAIGNDDYRPQFKGVYWDITSDAITFVTTDTRKLAKYRSTLVKPGLTMNFILAAHALPLLRAILPTATDVEVSQTPTSIVFEADDFKLTTAKINGRFPDYNRVIPSEFAKIVTVDVKSFVQTIARVGNCADSANPALALNLHRGYIDASARDLSLHISAEERVACDYDGPDFAIGFGSDNIESIVGVINTPRVVIKLNDASRAALFLPSENEEHGELTLLCMPMTINA